MAPLPKVQEEEENYGFIKPSDLLIFIVAIITVVFLATVGYSIAHR